MKRDIYINHFKGKKVTVMGLGLLGRGVGDTEFLLNCGSEILVTDLKTESELNSSTLKLNGYKNLKYRLGEHKLEDFESVDYVLKSAGVPANSKYISHARESGVEIIMSAAFVTKIIKENLPRTRIIGITGTRGKSTTTKLIYHIINNFLIRENQSNKTSVNVHLGGNIRGVANLPLLEVVEDGDYVVLELDSWQLQGYGDLKISPDVAVFTNFMPDHMNYYENSMELYFNDKANIFKWQVDQEDVLITNLELKEKINSIDTIHNIRVPEYFKSEVFTKFDSKLIGKHNQELISEAVEACESLGFEVGEILKYVETFDAEEGRLEHMGNDYGAHKNIIVYNDNNATTPEASAAAVSSISLHYELPIILITGGKTKGLALDNYVKVIKASRVDYIILLDNTGTQELILELNKLSITKYEVYQNLKECVDRAFDLCDKSSDKKIIIFSPAFASFSHEFNNEYERNDEFVKSIKSYTK
jgi:UDP-N-acetylmuramoylalanine--D-glutamate ligase